MADLGRPVWDCGTGNGQAAVALARHFDKVLATDPSSQQIEQATPHQDVEYSVGSAEASGLASNSVGTVVVAQALHWFDHSRFFAEAQRVAGAGSQLIVLGYTRPVFDTPALGKVFAEFAAIVEEDWPAERFILEAGYSDIEFPFEPVVAPAFEMAFQWPLAELLGYLGTWSAVRRHEQRTGMNAVAEMADAFASAWGSSEIRRVSWPLVLIAGTLN
jgi:ubiquinone/menaquinone biosynthesis C-methylase UbiE